MLRLMSRSIKKDENLDNKESSESGYDSDFIMGQKQKTNSFFSSIPGLFVGLNPKCSSDGDSVYSPTSPLDFRVLTNLKNPFRSPKASHDCHHKHFKCSRVGLSILNSSSDDDDVVGTKGSGYGRVSRSLECKKNIVVASRTRFKSSNFSNPFDCLDKPMSLPKDYGISTNAQMIKSSNLEMEHVFDSLFEIGEDPFEHESIRNGTLSRSLDSGRCCPTRNSFDYLNKNSVRTSQVYSPRSFGKSSIFDNIFPANMSSNSVYMCSPNAFVGRPSGSKLDLFDDDRRLYQCSEISGSFYSINFLSSCYACNKKLDGEDIYMYRGEKAFCSLECRHQEILIDGELEEEDTLDDFSDTTSADDQDG